ncbi:hypothetical protein [Caulobacter sp. FWC2]|uniref:hypothetical protein n=1 Tax=Caulobacter sp. FWC2 TaxID=69664 RepID=UPI000C14D8F3|nr:hypothetical protein [Caulobacter sp. FWC2]PIB89926.1 hypothetical protein CSW62_25115 [Caulobacter sp. FWC2]
MTSQTLKTSAASRQEGSKPVTTPASQPETEGARLSKLDAETESLRTKLAVQQGRLDELSTRKPPPPDRLGPIISGSGAAIALTGFFVVHYFSVRRQRRDEFFKRVQDCLTILERIGREAPKVWRRPGKDKDAQASLEILQADIDALTHRLALLHRLRPQFNVQAPLIDLTLEATLDVEGLKREADPARAERTRQLAQGLGKVIIEQYDQVYE